MKRKNLIFLCLLTIALLLTGSSALAVTTVVGTGDPKVDVVAVQEAVDGGGTVVLQGDFHFGNLDNPYGGWPFNEYGSVGIYNSVEIIGEGATINHGLGPLWMTARDTPGVDVIIRGSGDSDRLRFKNSRYAAIVVRECESLTIKHVNIDNVVAELGGQRYGINATNRWDTYPYNPNLLGKLSIIDCTIDLGVQDEEEYGTGMFIYGLGTPEKEVKILIKDNVISNCSAYGIDLFSIAGTGSVFGNTVMPGEIAFKYIGSGANGISVGQNPWDEFNFAGGPGTYQPDWAHIFVRNNDIECGSITEEGFHYTIGIEIFNLNGAVVRENKVKGEKGDIGSLISMAWAKNAFIKKNILSGTCLWCIEAYNSSEDIFVVGNDLRNVIPLQDEESTQLLFGRDTKNSLAVNNKIGEPGVWGGILVMGEKAHITNNTFYGENYPGWSEDWDPVQGPKKKGCVLLGSVSSNNMVVNVKLADPPPESDMCDQVLDRGTNNKVVGCKE